MEGVEEEYLMLMFLSRPLSNFLPLLQLHNLLKLKEGGNGPEVVLLEVMIQIIRGRGRGVEVLLETEGDEAGDRAIWKRRLRVRGISRRGVGGLRMMIDRLVRLLFLGLGREKTRVQIPLFGKKKQGLLLEHRQDDLSYGPRLEN